MFCGTNFPDDPIQETGKIILNYDSHSASWTYEPHLNFYYFLFDVCNVIAILLEMYCIVFLLYVYIPGTWTERFFSRFSSGLIKYQINVPVLVSVVFY